MIILDTDVLSELMRPVPHSEVFAWVANQPRDLLYTTHINQTEILYSVAALPEGRRRDALAKAAKSMFTEDFAGRILPFGGAAAERYPEIVLARRRAGNPLVFFVPFVSSWWRIAEPRFVEASPDGTLPDGQGVLGYVRDFPPRRHEGHEEARLRSCHPRHGRGGGESKASAGDIQGPII